jgi:hypothetical protein
MLILLLANARRTRQACFGGGGVFYMFFSVGRTGNFRGRYQERRKWVLTRDTLRRFVMPAGQ